MRRRSSFNELLTETRESLTHVEPNNQRSNGKSLSEQQPLLLNKGNMFIRCSEKSVPDNSWCHLDSYSFCGIVLLELHFDKTSLTKYFTGVSFEFNDWRITSVRSHVSYIKCAHIVAHKINCNYSMRKTRISFRMNTRRTLDDGIELLVNAS